MKTLKIMFWWLLGAFVLLQFIWIDVPPPPKATPADEIKAPPKIKELLVKACYDCHSNNTKWPWYSYVAPISFEVRTHVKNGRNWLNFSIWNRYSQERKQKLLKGIAKAIDWKMPPPDYMLMHKNARLTPEQRAEIKKWAISQIREDEEY